MLARPKTPIILSDLLISVPLMIIIAVNMDEVEITPAYPRMPIVCFLFTGLATHIGQDLRQANPEKITDIHYGGSAYDGTATIASDVDVQLDQAPKGSSFKPVATNQGDQFKSLHHEGGANGEWESTHVTGSGYLDPQTLIRDRVS